MVTVLPLTVAPLPLTVLPLSLSTMVGLSFDQLASSFSSLYLPADSATAFMVAWPSAVSTWATDGASSDWVAVPVLAVDCCRPLQPASNSPARHSARYFLPVLITFITRL